MTRAIPTAIATVFLALGALSVYAADSDAETPAAVSDGGLDAGALPLPKFFSSGDDLYPVAAVRKLMQGSVGVELQIDEQGRAQILRQTFADAPEFAENASEVLKRGHFKVPENWVQAGGPEQRFVVEVQFLIARGDAPCVKKPPHVADTEVVMVCWLQPTRRKNRL